jgi:hypothetical protein
MSYESLNSENVSSPQVSQLAAALSVAQGLIGGAVKDSNNLFFKTRYADLASVVSAIRPALSANGLSYLQRSHPNPDGVAIETVILHASGEWISTGIVAVPLSKYDAQGFGSAITYARRYSLQMAFGVAPEDDDGNAASGHKEGHGDAPPPAPRGKPTPPPQKANEAMRTALLKTFSADMDAGVPMDKLRAQMLAMPAEIRAEAERLLEAFTANNQPTISDEAPPLDSEVADALPEPLAQFALKLRDVQTVEGYNALIAEAGALGRPVNLQAWNMLRAQAFRLGLAYDKDSKAFFMPAGGAP